MICWRQKNNSSKYLRNQISDFKHFKMKCWKSSCRTRLQKKKRQIVFFFNFTKSYERVTATSQLDIFAGTVVLLALWSSFVRYRSSHLQMFYETDVLKISQNSQKPTGIRVSYVIRFQVSGFATLLKETQAFFCNFCEIFKNIFLYRTLPVAASIDTFLHCSEFTYLTYSFCITNSIIIVFSSLAFLFHVLKSPPTTILVQTVLFIHLAYILQGTFYTVI